MASTDETVYRWSRAFGLRIVGGAAMALAALWVLAAVLGFPAWLLVPLGVAGLIALGCLMRLVVFPLPLLELTDNGYRVRNTRGPGVAAAAWADVESIASEDAGQGMVMVIRLTDGRSSLVPLSLLGVEAQPAEKDVHERLNRAFGYRPLGDSRGPEFR